MGTGKCKDRDAMREARGTRPCYLAALISDAWIVTQCAKRVARIHASALSDDDECKDRDTMRVARGTRPCFLIEQSDVCKDRDTMREARGTRPCFLTERIMMQGV